jgi:hypothetical protein
MMERNMNSFLRQLFAEGGGASFSRAGSFIALIFACGWITRIVWITHALPPFDGVTLFIASLYGLGKVGEMVQRVIGGKQQPSDIETGGQRLAA